MSGYTMTHLLASVVDKKLKDKITTMVKKTSISVAYCLNTIVGLQYLPN